MKSGTCLGDYVEKDVVNPMRQKGQKRVSQMNECGLNFLRLILVNTKIV